MQINGYKVEVKKGGVKVGCTEVSLDQMKELVEQVERYKGDIGNILTAFESTEGHENNQEHIIKCINEVRKNISCRNFFGVRNCGSLSHQGFYLYNPNSIIKWEIVFDEDGRAVLVPKEE